MQGWRWYVGLTVLALCALLAVRPINDVAPQIHRQAISVVLDLSGALTVDGHAGTLMHDELVVLVESLRTGKASADEDAIKISGIAGPHDDWTQALESFRARLDPNVDLHTEIEIVDESVAIGELCERMFGTIASEPQIRFEESGSALNPASFAALDRIIDFARDCRKFELTITGHSDGSGYEPSNIDLSERRAQTVADYIAEGGIDSGRLHTDGKGSSEPIADNATRTGRQLNRRIEFALTPTNL